MISLGYKYVPWFQPRNQSAFAYLLCDSSHLLLDLKIVARIWRDGEQVLYWW
jgi:hypothetical protein